MLMSLFVGKRTVSGEGRGRQVSAAADSLLAGSPRTKRAKTGSSRPASASGMSRRRCSTSFCRPAGLARNGRVRLVRSGFFPPRSVAVGRSAHLRFSSAKSRICAWLGLDGQPDLATVELSPPRFRALRWNLAAVAIGSRAMRNDLARRPPSTPVATIVAMVRMPRSLCRDVAAGWATTMDRSGERFLGAEVFVCIACCCSAPARSAG